MNGLFVTKAHSSSLEAEGVVGTAELGIEQLSDECALGLFIARTVQRSDDDRWTQESGEKSARG